VALGSPGRQRSHAPRGPCMHLRRHTSTGDVTPTDNDTRHDARQRGRHRKPSHQCTGAREKVQRAVSCQEHTAAAQTHTAAALARRRRLLLQHQRLRLHLLLHRRQVGRPSSPRPPRRCGRAAARPWACAGPACPSTSRPRSWTTARASEPRTPTPTAAPPRRSAGARCRHSCGEIDANAQTR
jgi:hypothetical protein